MTWAEFRKWALDALGYHIAYGWGTSTTAAWKAVWGSDRGLKYAKTATRSGKNAVYGNREKLRLAAWLRAQDLVNPKLLAGWLTAAESHDDGWLINTGSGIRWISHDDLLAQAPGIAARGLPLVGIRCGI